MLLRARAINSRYEPIFFAPEAQYLRVMVPAARRSHDSYRPWRSSAGQFTAESQFITAGVRTFRIAKNRRVAMIFCLFRVTLVVFDCVYR